MASGKAAAPQLSADEIDDILYLARTNESAELQEYLGQLSQTHSCSIASLLQASVDPDNANTPFHYCSANGYTELLSTLIAHLPAASRKETLNRRNAAGNTALHWAALNGHVAAVKTLCDAGVDVWVKNAAGNLPVFEAERAEKDDVVAALLLAGGKEEEERMRGKEGATDEQVGEEGDVDGAADSMDAASLQK